jgi:glucuronoarabinoxylan endo-1,4-beta-xylanase
MVLETRRQTMQLTRAIVSAGLVAGTLVGLSGNVVQAAATRYEVETSPGVCTGTIDSNWSGYSGAGFCNGDNAVGAYAQFTVTASLAGAATLRIKFANGTTTARSADVIVNGSTVQLVSFEGTGAWSTWATKTMTVSVRSGSNTIRFNPAVSAGLPNVDYLETDVAGQKATIDGAIRHQRIDGFGFSEHFGRGKIMRGSQGLPAQKQREVLDLLLSRSTGAGLSILRLGISSGSASIQPTNPGGPNATPRYVWDRNDDGQLWLAQEAKAYGVNRFYADAWSAPGYMKTNGTEGNGGTLCGLSGASCASGDWRRAYANYLVQYTKFYAQEGITINDLGFINEPDYTTSYASMRLTPAQAVEFVKVLGPVARSAGVKVACCDAMGWNSQKNYTNAIEADSTARGLVDLHAGHSYSSPVNGPLATSKSTWMSEWNPSGTAWNENWDDRSGYDGFAIADAIHTALTTGRVNAYVYWYGASTGATRGFIQLDGDTYRVSKRLWAMANYSRFIRPGATRINAWTADSTLRLSAFRNTDGTVIVVALNTASSANQMSFALPNTGISTGTATPYLTNGSSSMAAQSPISVTGGAFTGAVPARSLVSYVIRPA